MDGLIILVAALFLPLFPASLLFSFLYRRLGDPRGRVLMLLLWPQAGLLLLALFAPGLPSWWAGLVLASAAFYALRALVLKEVNLWAGFLFLSIAPLGWLIHSGTGVLAAHAMLLLMTAPVALVVLLAGEMARRHGAAYLGLTRGLVSAHPRLAALLAASVLALMATPPFPSFFFLLQLLAQSPLGVAAAILGLWYLWGWAAVRFFQQLAVEDEAAPPIEGDLPDRALWAYLGTLGGFALVGLGVALDMAGGV